MRFLTKRDVLKRMRAGDLPTKSCYAGYADFADGAQAKGYTMRLLVLAGLVRPPAHTSVHSSYTLVEATEDAK